MYRSDGCENGVKGICAVSVCVGGNLTCGGGWMRGCVCVYIYIVLTRFRPEPKSPDQRPRAPTEGHNQWNRLCTDLSRYTRNFSPPLDTSESTRPVAVPRNTTYTACWRMIKRECTIRLYYYIISIFFLSSCDHNIIILPILLYCIVLVRCVIRITGMVFTRHRPRSRGQKVTGRL